MEAARSGGWARVWIRSSRVPELYHATLHRQYLAACFWKLYLISGDIFFFLTSRCSGALPIPLTPSSLAFLSSPNASHFSAGFLLGCLTNCPLCGRGERRAQPKRFSAFNLSYSTSCWDLLLTLNKSLSHAWCGPTSFSAAQLAAKRLRELCLNVWCDADTTRKIRPYEEGNSVCGCIRILWVTDNLVYCKMEVMLSLRKV